ncbi:MAG: molecular chaperone [Bacteroidota bacterium]|jgi:fimbrial chaperone protein
MKILRFLGAARAAALLFFCLAVAGAVPAGASSIQVDPIRVDFEPGATSATLFVRNSGDAAVVLQAELNDWTMDEAGERYSPTSALIVAPPVMTIAAGAEQVVRLGLRAAADPSRERAFRLFLTEVPPPPQPGFRGLQVALRVGIPVFLRPAAKTPPRLEWSAARTASGEIRVSVANDGTAHVRLLSLEAIAAGAATPAASQGPAYVLAGSRRTFTLAPPPGAAAERVRVKIATEHGQQETEFGVAPK